MRMWRSRVKDKVTADESSSPKKSSSSVVLVLPLTSLLFDGMVHEWRDNLRKEASLADRFRATHEEHEESPFVTTFLRHCFSLGLSQVSHNNYASCREWHLPFLPRRGQERREHRHTCNSPDLSQHSPSPGVQPPSLPYYGALGR